MKEMRLVIGSTETKVCLSSGSIDSIGESICSVFGTRDGRRAVLVTDDTVGELYGAQASSSLAESGWRVSTYSIKPGEQSKRLTTAGAIYQFLAEQNIGRDSVLIALGGGVVSDLTGFVAATWMRGVDFAICPTSLEACVDASIGGKTGVNVPGGKNLVGAFHQPKLVAIDPAVLMTLPARDIRAGLAESIKHGLLFSETFLTWHERNASALLALAGSFVEELIARNVSLKGEIVSRDAQERTGNRILLNFGHTIGHAIEACCGYAWRHGECVSLGMLAACRLSQMLGLLHESVVRRVEGVLQQFELPTRMPENMAWDQIRAAIAKDKKASGGEAQFVLLRAVGEPLVQKGINESDLKAAYESLLP